MPAINVARTDTFEKQRVKINEIGSILFNISAGGSDLATGNLKLGDGTKTVPSLAFSTDATLGLYKPNSKAIGFVSGSKRIINIQEDSFVSFKDFNVINKSLNTGGMVIDSTGTGYDPGTFTDVEIDGGTGDLAEATIVVAGFLGSTTQAGLGYASGNHIANLSGGNGTGATAVLRVPQLVLTTTSAGSNFAPSTFSDVPLTGGTGTGATAEIIFNGTLTVSGSITDAGTGYVTGGYNGISLAGGSGTGFTAVLEVNASGVFTVATPEDSGSNYEVGDVLTLDAAAYPLIVGASGAGFEYTISALSGNGSVESISVSQSGQGYETGDTLSVNLSDVGNYAGSVAPTFEISNDPLQVDEFTISAFGSGYQVGDVLTPAGPLTGVAGTVVEGSFNITVADSSGIGIGSAVAQTSGSGFQEGTDPSVPTVVSIPDATTVETSHIAFSNGSGDFSFSPAYGSPSQDLQYTITQLGIVDSITITNGGSGYDVGDIVTVDARDLVNPIEKLVTVDAVETITLDTPVANSTFSVGDLIDFQNGEILPIVAVIDSGSQTTAIVVLGSSLAAADSDFTLDGVPGTPYTIGEEPVPANKFKINGSYTWDNDPLYVDSKYLFDFSDPSNGGHAFALSEVLDGTQNVASANGTLANNSFDVPITDPSLTATILPGTVVSILDDAVVRDGEIAAGTTVVSVDTVNNTITLDTLPTTSGAADLTFTGVEMITGVVRDVVNSTLTLTVSSSTPSPLYGYCPFHVGMAVSPSGVENKYVVDPNNPKVFGSGAQFSTISISEDTNISFAVATGTVNATSVSGTTLDFDSGTIDDLTALTAKSGSLTVDVINADSGEDGADKIDVNAGTGLSILTGNFNIGTTLQVENSTGNLTTSGVLKSTGSINSNDQLIIQDNKIYSTSGNDIEIEPAGIKQTKVISTSAFVIPAGSTDQRPIESESYDGAIRFNSETNQYEGYSTTSSAWSSLGGVRDLDGNTFILAEENVGVNDNTLWFFNDNINTFKFSSQYLEFVNVKNVRSPNITAPDYSEWTANTPVSLGDYLKRRNNIYEVTVVANTGVGETNLTGTSGNDPTHTTGTVTNGDVELTYFTTAVANLTFDEINEVRIDPLGFTDLVVNDELRFSENVISTNVNDLVIQPNGGQKVVFLSDTSLVVPVGPTATQGVAIQGSIRYNTTDTQFEGYNGTQWGGLGGVKDVDQDTKIEAESAPGADEDTLTFFNAGSETIRLSATSLDFDTVNVINSPTSNTLDVNATTITFDNLSTTLLNTDSTSTFLFTTKDNFDFGLSSGLNTDSLIRLNDLGEVFYNVGFGTGIYNGIKILSSDLTQIELGEYKITTKTTDLERGSIDSGDAIVYDPAVHKSAKVQLSAHNVTTGDKEFVEYSVIDNGVDIFFTDFGNISTGENLVDTNFSFNESSEVRISYTLNSDLTTGDDVEVTVISHITKR